MPASIIAFPAPRIVPPAPARPQSQTRTFEAPGRFKAMTAAEAMLRTCGFSAGPMQGVMPRGIRFGRCVMSKWGDMGAHERLTLHGRLTGDMVHGPVTVELYNTAPADAHLALARFEA